MSKIEIKNVYKIFGDQPSKVLPMVRDGATKEEILEKTGHTVGLDNVSLFHSSLLRYLICSNIKLIFS